MEVWKDIVGYEGYYQVSNLGRVKSLERIIERPYRKGSTKIVFQTIKERIRCPGEGGGHLFVPLYKDGISTNWSVHELVLEAFVCPRPTGLEGCHWDGDYKNNRVENLRWDTHKGNHQDRIRHGTNNRGEKNGVTKMTEEKVIQARDMYATGLYLMADVAKAFGISTTGMVNIIRGINWGWVNHYPQSNFGRGLDRLKRLEEARETERMKENAS